MDEKKRLEKRTNNKLYPAVYEAEFVMLAQAGGCWDTPGKVGEHKTRFKDYQLKITLWTHPPLVLDEALLKFVTKRGGQNFHIYIATNVFSCQKSFMESFKIILMSLHQLAMWSRNNSVRNKRWRALSLSFLAISAHPVSGSLTPPALTKTSRLDYWLVI